MEPLGNEFFVKHVSEKGTQWTTRKQNVFNAMDASLRSTGNGSSPLQILSSAFRLHAREMEVLKQRRTELSESAHSWRHTKTESATEGRAHAAKWRGNPSADASQPPSLNDTHHSVSHSAHRPVPDSRNWSHKPSTPLLRNLPAAGARSSRSAVAEAHARTDVVCQISTGLVLRSGRQWARDAPTSPFNLSATEIGYV